MISPLTLLLTPIPPWEQSLACYQSPLGVNVLEARGQQLCPRSYWGSRNLSSHLLHPATASGPNPLSLWSCSPMRLLSSSSPTSDSFSKYLESSVPCTLLRLGDTVETQQSLRSGSTCVLPSLILHQPFYAAMVQDLFSTFPSALYHHPQPAPSISPAHPPHLKVKL